jgi:hypothetical protein
VDIKEVMRRQAGPMPVWAWTALFASFVAGIIIFRRRMKPPTSASQPSTSASGASGEFQSGQATTTTDDKGNTITTQYSASGPLTGYPGMLTTQAGPMPYSGGDVYVNYPATNAAPPPPAQTTTDKRTVLNPAFNMVGWNDKAKASPWTAVVANPGETWKDITARVYGFAGNYAAIKNDADRARVDQVSTYIKDTNSKWTGMVPDGTGPTPGSVVIYR